MSQQKVESQVLKIDIIVYTNKHVNDVMCICCW